MAVEAVSLSKLDVHEQVRAAGWTQVKKKETWVWLSPSCKLAITSHRRTIMRGKIKTKLHITNTETYRLVQLSGMASLDRKSEEQLLLQFTDV
jgi:hypothetical protein